MIRKYNPEQYKKFKEVLPARRIRNTTLWVNNDFPLFRLKVGEKAPIALFFAPETKEVSDEDREKSLIARLEVLPGHRRSGIIGRVYFQDEQGRLYRDIDIKGAGYIYPDPFPEKMRFGSIMITGAGVSGLENREDAEKDRDFSEKFVNAGIRSTRVIAIIQPYEIIDIKGNTVSIDEAKKIGIIPERYEPVLTVRAFGVKTRVNEPMERSRKFFFLDDARKFVAFELNKNIDEFSFKDYMEWFAETLGKNIGLMHSNGWAHGNLWTGYANPSNVTLDCRIVDLDTVRDRTSEPQSFLEYSRQDPGDAEMIIRQLYEDLEPYLQQKIELSFFLNLFQKTYKEMYQGEE
jgi:hypothetical protein